MMLILSSKFANLHMIIPLYVQLEMVSTYIYAISAGKGRKNLKPNKLKNDRKYKKHNAEKL